MPSEPPELQTPPRSPHLVHIPHDVDGLQLTRKRTHSVMSAGHAPVDAHLHRHTLRRSNSMQSLDGGQSPHDDLSPRTRTIKRNDPPVNQDGKYFCDFAAECDGQTFDRKCEWSKHMDKHDRPYRCAHPSCAKLQGFTYSGGLLRHEREVHGKHGGPKAQLMCPYTNCKRHSGKGFTRKENLNEHIRRVHESRTQTSTGMPMKRDMVADALMAAESAETPVSRISEALNSDDNISPALKRRRPMLSGLEEAAAAAVASAGNEDIDEMRQELMHLRADNADKDARLAHMQQQVEEADRRLRQMHDEMRQMQQAHAATQA